MTASEIDDLVRAAFGTRPDRYELEGGDAGGADEYPTLVAAHASLVAAMGDAREDVRIAAAHAVSLIVDEQLAAVAQPVLDAAARSPVMMLAAGRLRASMQRWRGPEARWRCR